jgi:glycosyltransferase involved in cell wall biosynthesis
MTAQLPIIDVVMPALNEADAIGKVIDEIPKDWIRRIVIGDNGSTDNTAQVARDRGAIVVPQPERGYGAACLAALDFLRQDPPDIVVFLDADHSDHPDELPLVVSPILDQGFDLVIGSRTRGHHEPGALLPQAIFGNWLSCWLIRLLYNVEFSDLGPFRAIRWSSLEQLRMQDRNFGWTVEMQVKAAKARLRCTEVPVRYRKRIGHSKVTGTIQGSVRAGQKILYTIFREALRP